MSHECICTCWLSGASGIRADCDEHRVDHETEDE